MSESQALPTRPGVLLLRLALALLALKAIGLAADPQLRLFMGDSASYLHSAISGWIPEDRSWTYGRMIGRLALPFGHYGAILGLQAAMGVATALLLFVLLHVQAGVGARLAALASLLLALDPAQLFYERMLMAESAGGLMLALLVVCWAEWLRARRGFWLLGASLAGLAAVSLRFSLLPMVAGLALLLPAWAQWRAPGPAWRRAAGFALALALPALLFAGYAADYGRRTGGPPSLMPAGGMMRLGVVAPLVRAGHFDGTGVDGAAVLASVTLPLDDPASREAHVWHPDGLFAAIRRHTANPQKVAATVAGRALRAQPLGLLPLARHNFAGYFDAGTRAYRIDDDLGSRAPDDRTLRLMRQRFAVDLEGVSARATPAARWYRAGVPWLASLLWLLPLLAMAALLLSAWRGGDPARTRVALVVALAGGGLIAAILLFAHAAVPRYLHPLPWFAFAAVALLVDAIRRARAGPGAGSDR